MLIEELQQFHDTLWKPIPPQRVIFRGNAYPVEVLNDFKRLFRRVIIENRIIITQNLRKPSMWTRYCNESPYNHVTWLIKDGIYTARVESSRHGSQTCIKIIDLQEQRVVLDTCRELSGMTAV